MLQASDVSFYQNNGYLPGQPILSCEETTRLFAECLRCCGPEKKDTGFRQPFNRVKPYLLFPWAADLARHRAILDAVEALIGPDILLFHTTVWFKGAESASFVPWHQDATYFGLDPLEQVTAWVALTPSNLDNGCVQLLPGSHRSGQRPHQDRADERVLLSRGQTFSESLDESLAVDLILAPGDVSFHHTLLVHRSAPNKSREPRIGFGISYIPTHVRHVGPTRLSASLVRGTDRYENFDTEPRPDAENSPAAIAAHSDSLARFRHASTNLPEITKAPS